MEEYWTLLKDTILFSGFTEEETKTIFKCVGFQIHCFEGGNAVFKEGDHVDEMMILLDGCLHIQKGDIWGNRSIYSIVLPGDIFGYCALDSEVIPNDILAVEKSHVLFFDASRVLSSCKKPCLFYSRIVMIN